MKNLDQILSYNHRFVQNKQFEPYQTGSIPKKKMVIVTCMDTRLTELLPKAMNISNGDAKIIKTAGAYITDPFGGEVRSVLIAISMLQAEEVFVVGHHRCGFVGLQSSDVVSQLQQKGVDQGNLSTIDPSQSTLENWLTGPSSVEEAVNHSADLLANHPLLPDQIPVHRMIIHPNTGKLETIPTK